MNIAADSQTNLDPERLRCATENISGMQAFSMRGLGYVAFGATFAMMQMAEVYWRGSDWVGLVVLMCIGLYLASLVYVPRYYRWRFGWAEPRKAPVPQWISNLNFQQVFLAVAALFLLWVLVEWIEHALLGRIDLMPLLTWLMALCVALWLPQSLRRTRFLLFLTVIGIAWITFYPLWHRLDASQLLLWKTLNAGSLGFGCIILGIYDHIMMVRVMPKMVAECEHD